MRCLIVFAFIISVICSPAESQRVDLGFYVDYKFVMDDLKKSPVADYDNSKWDLTFILLLDSTDIRLINKLRPDIVEDFRKNYSEPIIKNSKKIIPVKVNSIHAIVKDFRKYIFPDNDNGKLKMSFPYYFKDDNKAIFEIDGYCTEVYRVTLQKDKLLIELIYKIVD